ncbi:MAG: hypothetical protein AUJ55_12075 [Proteobacteria bacterium CG1_02_64_396]|nr:MAG: hypothetical protein AUJ55_12075 [Proteobacteria bacterium CG1_02_64_396]
MGIIAGGDGWFFGQIFGGGGWLVLNLVGGSVQQILALNTPKHCKFSSVGFFFILPAQPPIRSSIPPKPRSFMLHSLFTHHGLGRSIAAATTTAILASIALTTAILSMLGVQDWQLGLSLAAVIPLTLAPPHTYLTYTVIHQLDQTQKTLQQLATIDDLTGCLNRRNFLEQAQTVLTQARRHRFPVALLMIDIDRFKQINDDFGHEAGDVALSALGRLLADVKRESDLIGRIGGEEFAMLLPHTDQEGGRVAGERIRRALRHLSLPIDHGSVVVTVSIGIAGSQGGQADLGRLLRDADQAMYRAKNEGRDRIALA